MQKVCDVSANYEGYLVDFYTNKIIFITYSQTFATCHLRVYFAEVSWNSTLYRPASTVLPTLMLW